MCVFFFLFNLIYFLQTFIERFLTLKKLSVLLKKLSFHGRIDFSYTNLSNPELYDGSSLLSLHQPPATDKITAAQ